MDMLLHKSLQDNNQDLQEFCRDLKSWTEEMKEEKKDKKKADNNESQVSSADIKKNNSILSKKTNKSKLPKDYSYWEKLDVDKECAKVDEDYDVDSESNSDISNEMDTEFLEKALEEKEKGNKFVKCGRYEDAIKAYSKAIDYHHSDATFYANRALCYLKVNLFKNAETDCTIALQLDKNYVKAYYRRACARESLKQYKEAASDLKKILQMEPNNKEAQILLEKLLKNSNVEQITEVEQQRPISKFTASKQKTRELNSSKRKNFEGSDVAFKDQVIERKNPQQQINNKQKVINEDKGNGIAESVKTDSKEPKLDLSIGWPSGSDVNLVRSYTKDSKQRSKVPLKNIIVKQV